MFHKLWSNPQGNRLIRSLSFLSKLIFKNNSLQSCPLKIKSACQFLVLTIGSPLSKWQLWPATKRQITQTAYCTESLLPPSHINNTNNYLLLLWKVFFFSFNSDKTLRFVVEDTEVLLKIMKLICGENIPENKIPWLLICFY